MLRPLSICVPFVLALPALAQSFTGMGDLPDGGFESGAYGVSADGRTVVGRGKTGSGREAVRWRDGVLTPLGDLAGGAIDSYADSCNFDGSVIVGTGTDAAHHRPLRWDGLALSQLPQASGFQGGAVVDSISADGHTIIGYDTDGDTSGYSNVTAYRIDDGVLTALIVQGPSNLDSAPQGAASADGRVLAGRIRDANNGYQACYWTGTVLTPLPNLPGGQPFSNGYGVSADGTVIIGVSASSSSTGGAFEGEPCRWVANVPTGLGDLPGGAFKGLAFSCNHDGSVIVGTSDTASGARAFIWDAQHGMRDFKSVLASDYGLSTTGWTLSNAYAITPDGSVIVGDGTNPNGNTEGWIARLSCTTTWAYCTAGTTSSGCNATLSASGTPSATSASGFTITASGVEGAKQGLFFYGTSGAQASPWGTGTSFLCVKSPTQRTSPQNSGGVAGSCNGALALDWNAFVAANPTALGAPFAGGDSVDVQAWFRDPPAPKSTSLSNALTFLVCP